MITMYRVKKGDYLLFASTLELAAIARRAYPQLKGGRIKNILQAYPSRIELCALYKDHEIVDRGKL